MHYLIEESIIKSKTIPINFPTNLESFRTFSSKTGKKNIAGISSFGFSGNNKRVITKQTILREFSKKLNNNNNKSENCLIGVAFLFQVA